MLPSVAFVTNQNTTRFIAGVFCYNLTMMKSNKKIKPILLFLLIFILSFTFIYNITSKPESINPNAQEVINTILIPFCETKNKFSEADLPKYFSQQYIDFFNSRQTIGKPKDIEVAITKNRTALTTARGYYERLFIKNNTNQDCQEYFRKINNISFKPFSSNPNYYSDFKLRYSITKSMNVSISIYKENNSWKIRAISTEMFINL